MLSKKLRSTVRDLSRRVRRVMQLDSAASRRVWPVHLYPVELTVVPRSGVCRDGDPPTAEIDRHPRVFHGQRKSPCGDSCTSCVNLPGVCARIQKLRPGNCGEQTGVCGSRPRGANGRTPVAVLYRFSLYAPAGNTPFVGSRSVTDKGNPLAGITG